MTRYWAYNVSPSLTYFWDVAMFKNKNRKRRNSDRIEKHWKLYIHINFPLLPLFQWEKQEIF